MSWLADGAAPAAPRPHAAVHDDLERRFGLQLRRLRRERRWSLDRLSAASGVSRAMLGQIELGKSGPTVRVLMRIAAGLGVDAAALLAPAAPPRLQVLRHAAAGDGQAAVRALGTAPAGNASFHALHLPPGGAATHPAEAAGRWRVNAVVARGTVEVEIDGQTLTLAEHDALQAETAQPLRWRNAGAALALVHAVCVRDAAAP